MTKHRHSLDIALTLLTMVLAVAVACRKEQPSGTPDAGAQQAADAEVEAVLAKADGYDGSEDKVIAKCPACALHMDGSVDNVVMTHGYTMRFCSPDCKVRFEEDLDNAILALDVPEEEEP